MATYERSINAYLRAKRVIPGGVDSPVRAFRAVGGSPLFVRSAQGATFIDLDGREYIDYVMSWGPLILGHAAANRPDQRPVSVHQNSEGKRISTLTECNKQLGIRTDILVRSHDGAQSVQVTSHHGGSHSVLAAFD